jgi:uncharacterized protein with FMN-binding domain
MKLKKKGKKWVLLCSTAVAAVYAAGYFSTESEAALGQQPFQQVQKSEQTNQISSSNKLVSNSQTNSQGGKQAVQTQRLYKDGAFKGTGMNRRGYIEVQVTLKSDKITDVEISDFAMHYSERDVVGLPDEVLQKQSAQVDNVSGATYSTEAFQDAVQQALDQARNA